MIAGLPSTYRTCLRTTQMLVRGSRFSRAAMASGALLPAVHASPENWKVVRPRGSQHWLPAAHDTGHRDALVLVTNIGPSTGKRTCLGRPYVSATGMGK